MIFFIIPKTTGFGLSKRRVSFHKTTRIFFEGFSHPSSFVLGSESAPGSGVARLFVSLLFFARSCCFFACFSTFLWLNSPFFLIILVVLILCVLLRRGSYNHWKQPAKVQNLSRQKCRLLYFYGACLYIIPKTTGFVFSKRRVSFHKTTRIFFEGFHTPLFCVWTVLSFRAFVCFALSFVSVPRFRFGCSDSFFCFLLFSWFCLVVVALCVLLHTRKVLAGLSHVGWKQCRHRQDTKTFFGTLIFAENQQNRPTIRP